MSFLVPLYLLFPHRIVHSQNSCLPFSSTPMKIQLLFSESRLKTEAEAEAEAGASEEASEEAS